MFNLSLLSIFSILYFSLYLVKMIITWPLHSFMAREALQRKDIPLPQNWTIDNYARRIQIFYFIGAGFSLIIFLIPTLYHEGLLFFKSYSKSQLESFIED